MTILFLSRLFYPHIGGVEKHILEVSKRLIKKGHKIIVVAEKHQEGLKNIEKIGDITVYRIAVGRDDWFKKFRIWNWFWKNRKLISDAEIIHAHDVFFWYFPFRFLYPNKKIFTTFHGYENFPISKKAIMVRKISEKLSFGNICIGEFIKKWYGTKPTYISYGGVIIPKNKISKTLKESAVFIGRLDEQTGFLTYLEAIKLIRKKIPNFKFTVFGDGKSRSKIDKDIDFRGFVKTPEKELSKFNFIFASRYLSILEAMAAKKPVIAVYDNSIKRDYLKMSPFVKYITITNLTQRVAEKIMDLLKDSDRSKRMIDEGYNWVKTQSWENVTEKYLMLWKK